jgi:hypothetical protein
MSITQELQQRIQWETENLLTEKAENEEFSTSRTSPTDYPLEYEFSIGSSDYLNPNTDTVTFYVPLETYFECFQIACETVMQETFQDRKTG